MGKRKLGRARILFFPALALVFIVGWCMYRVGNQKRTGKAGKQAKADGVTFLPMVLEEPQELIHE